MTGKNQQFGKYGARGIKGSEAVARQLDKLVTYIATPITSPRGLLARLRYLTSSSRTRQAAREAGLDVTDRTLKAWQKGMRNPTTANLERIEKAYRAVRRHNVAQQLRKRLEADGGTRVEIHPFNQSQVNRPRQRPVPFRHLNVRHWGPLVDAWADGNESAMEEAWDDEIADLGSTWGQYEYVSNVGFAV